MTSSLTRQIIDFCRLDNLTLGVCLPQCKNQLGIARILFSFSKCLSPLSCLSEHAREVSYPLLIIMYWKHNEYWSVELFKTFRN